MERTGGDLALQCRISRTRDWWRGTAKRVQAMEMVMGGQLNEPWLGLSW